MPKRVPTYRPGSALPTQQPKREDTHWRRFINSRPWRACSRSYLTANPLCVRCKARGLTVAATQVHHTEGQAEEHKFDWATLEARHSMSLEGDERGEWMHEHYGCTRIDANGRYGKRVGVCATRFCAPSVGHIVRNSRQKGQTVHDATKENRSSFYAVRPAAWRRGRGFRRRG